MTAYGNDSGQGVYQTAAGIHRIYLHSRRLGGTGFGIILSVAAPDQKVGTVPSDQSPDDERYSELDKRLELYQAMLASAQLYATNGLESLLCISGSGKKFSFAES